MARDANTVVRQARDLAHELRRYRKTRRENKEIAGQADTADLSAQAHIARVSLIEESVTAGLSHLPAAMRRLGHVLRKGDDKTAVLAARTLLEVAQLIGPRTLDRLSPPAGDGLTIGQLEDQLRTMQARLEARKASERVVSTQSATEPSEKT